MNRTATLHLGHVLDVLAGLPEKSIHCCVTSPPYWGLRDYKLPALTWPDGWRGSLGLEPTVQLYVEHMVEVGRAIWRVLRDDGTLWLNLGDAYALAGGAGLQGRRGQRFGRRHTQEPLVRHRANGDGPKPKDLIGLPWRVALALQDDGWYLRSEIIWAKPAPMPESVRDRPTKAHEHVFLLSKSPTYFYDADAVREPDKGTDHARTVMEGQASRDPSGGTMARHRGLRTVNGRNGQGRNLRTVWTIGPEPCPEAHFATFPSEIPRRAILAGTSAGGCCSTCGAPWTRAVDRSFERQTGVSESRAVRGNGATKGQAPESRWAGSPRGRTVTTTTGWQPACACGDRPVPCSVLDPFLGSGRSGFAALELGRSFVGIDLSRVYLETIARPAIEAALQQARIGEASPPSLSLVEHHL